MLVSYCLTARVLLHLCYYLPEQSPSDQIMSGRREIFVTAGILIILFALAGLAASGCSSADRNPVLTAGSEVVQTVNAPGSSTYLCSYYSVWLDRERNTMEWSVDRSALFTANIVSFLNSDPFSLAFHLNDLDANTDYLDLDLDIVITHPFADSPEFNAYDVRGIFMGNGSQVLTYNDALVYPVGNSDPILLPDPDDGSGGPDGYTRWYNFTEFSLPGNPLFTYVHGNLASHGFSGSATLCPYRYFADGVGPADDLCLWLVDNPATRGVFSSGATNVRKYYVRFPSGSEISFGYAVIASWAGKQIEMHPANTPEAVACDVTSLSTVYYNNPGDSGGRLILDVSLFAWDVQPSRLVVESTVLSGPASLNPAEIATGGGSNYSTYHIDLQCDNVTSSDGNEFWIVVEYEDFGYANEYGVPNDAGTDPLASFFRYDLVVPTCIHPGWAATWGDSGADVTNGSTVDPYGYPVITGYSQVAGGIADGVLLKYSPQGDLVFEKRWGGTLFNSGNKVSVDDQGNIYVCGDFSGTTDFDPGEGVEERSSDSGSRDPFLVKFNNDGEFLWVRTWGSSTFDSGKAVTTTSSGMVYVCGYFEGTLDFNPPSGELRTSNGMRDASLVCYDPDGQFQWVRTWGGDDIDGGMFVTSDQAGNAYVTGHFQCEDVDFDPGPDVELHSSSGERDVFLSSFDEAGNFRWVACWGGTQFDQGYGAGVNGTGFIYSTGYFMGTVDFDPGPGVFELTSNNFSRDVFLTCFDLEGSLQWAVSWGSDYDVGTMGDYGSGITFDDEDNIYVGGVFLDTVDFDPGLGTLTLSSNGELDASLSKFTSSGDFIWARTWGGVQNDNTNKITFDGQGGIFISGIFRDAVDFAQTDYPCFDPQDIHTSNGSIDLYLARYLTDGCW